MPISNTPGIPHSGSMRALGGAAGGHLLPARPHTVAAEPADAGVDVRHASSTVAGRLALGPPGCSLMSGPTTGARRHPSSRIPLAASPVLCRRAMSRVPAGPETARQPAAGN